jgi:PhnB protein
MHVQPYLFFEGRCEEALEFYGKALGARTQALMRYKEAPPSDTPMPNVQPDKVMHAEFVVGDSTIMASDGMCSGKPTFGGVSLTVAAKDAAEAGKLFNALADGGQVQMPLGPTFFAGAFGVLADRFGVSWMVIADPIGGPA